MLYGMNNSCNICLAGINFNVTVEFEEALSCFIPYLTQNPGISYKLALTNEEWNYVSRFGIKKNAQNEASLMTAIASDYLILHKKCIIHGAAFLHEEKAYLIIAPSGTGKSTQVMYLNKLYNNQFPVICGDRPILEITDSKVIVHPSPWNGKENWRGALSAPLDGIICLNRGDHNCFKRVKPKEMVKEVLTSVIMTYKESETIILASRIIDLMLKRVRVYSLTSNTVPDSTKLMYDVLFRKGDIS